MSLERKFRPGAFAACMAVAVLFTGGLGGLLLARALAPRLLEPVLAEVPGRVVAVQASGSASRRRPGTYYRPIVEYQVEGRTLQAASRSRYRPAPFRVGDPVPVLLGDDGSVWLKPEWESERASARADANRERTTLLVLGSLLGGAALFGAVLTAALLLQTPGRAAEPM